MDELRIPSDTCAAMLSVTGWILRGAEGNNMDHAALQSELLQLGTPREHAGTISRVYRDRSQSLRLSTLGTGSHFIL